MNKYALIQACIDPNDLLPTGTIKVPGSSPTPFGMVVSASECEVSEGYEPDGSVRNYRVAPGDVIYFANVQGAVGFGVNLGRRYGLVHAGYIMLVIKSLDAKAMGITPIEGDGTIKASAKLVMAGAMPAGPIAI